MTVALKFFSFSFLKIAIRFWNGVMTRKLLISFLDLLICGKGDCEIYMLKMNLVKTHFQVVGAIRPGGGEFPERVGQPVCQVCGVNVFFSPIYLNLKKVVRWFVLGEVTFAKGYTNMFPYVQIV